MMISFIPSSFKVAVAGT